MFQRRAMHPSEIPVVVKNLLIINILLFAAKFVFEYQFGKDVLSDKLALYHPKADSFHFYQYITYQFMHADFMHLLMNMVGLLLCGVRLESAWGAKRFLVFYIVCGIGAGASHSAWVSYQVSKQTKPIHEFLENPELGAFRDLTNYYSFPGINPAWITVHAEEVERQARLGQTKEALVSAENMCDEILYEAYNTPGNAIVGASGSVFGILIAFGFLFANTQISLMFIPVPFSAKWLAIFLGLLEVLRSIENRPDDYVAHLAHVGGMVTGFILLKIYQRNRNQFY